MKMKKHFFVVKCQERPFRSNAKISASRILIITIIFSLFSFFQWMTNQFLKMKKKEKGIPTKNPFSITTKVLDFTSIHI